MFIIGFDWRINICLFPTSETRYFSQRVWWQLYFHHLFWDGKMAIFITCWENSNSCEIGHFHISKQTVKVQFSLDVLGKIYFSLSYLKYFFATLLAIILIRYIWLSKFIIHIEFLRLRRIEYISLYLTHREISQQLVNN